MKDDGVLSVLYNTQGIALAGPSGLVSPGFSYSLCVTRHDLQSFPLYFIVIGINYLNVKLYSVFKYFLPELRSYPFFRRRTNQL